MGRRQKRKTQKLMRRTMRLIGLFAADALAEFAGNALYHGMKRLTRDHRGDKPHKKGAHAHHASN
jgi:hypothetical protein